MKKEKLSLEDPVFTRAIEDVVTREEVEMQLAGGTQLRVKHGIDVTAPDLHIGHAVSLWKIRELQEAGHKAVIILGDFTTRIGDPTGKSATRPVLPEDVIKKNSQNIQKQIEKILLTDPNLYEVRKNSEWFGRMRALDFFQLLSVVTHAHLISRDMFQERIREGREITMAEMLYPILQGYDSVAITSDLTIIGSDQLFNEHMARFFQEKFGQHPQTIVTVKLLPGLDGGAKMSKSLGNYISLIDTPEDMFGKAMRMQDSLLIPYFEAYTALGDVEIREKEAALKKGANPMEVKLDFAEELVARYHGREDAARERKKFITRSIWKKNEGTGTLQDVSESIPEIAIAYGEWDVAELLRTHFKLRSNAEVQRLVAQGGVSCDGTSLDPKTRTLTLRRGMIIRVGKKKLVKVA
ncbi:MAG: tyrosyl-tRNA synthetase [Parcubacteria group bacterium Gr01-1014_66]|nr:MAG: tyrosyl-tRNA synthetase [Parcubacteria group bacterium Gr01-1014_66]